MMDETRQIYHFDVRISNADTADGEMADAIDDVMSDASLSSSGGIVKLNVHRDATSPDAAIRSATADIRKAGYSVDQITIDADAFGATAEMA